MLKKLTLVLLLGSVVAQPLMAVTPIDSYSAICRQAFNGAKQVDMDAFTDCMKKCQASASNNSSQFTKVMEHISENAPAYAIGAFGIGALLFYTFIWPDVAIRVSYQKNSRAELQAGRRP